MISAFKNYQRYNIATRQVIPGDERCEGVAKAKNVSRGRAVGDCFCSISNFGASCLPTDACEKGHIAFVRPPPTSTLKNRNYNREERPPSPRFFLRGRGGALDRLNRQTRTPDPGPQS